MNHTYTRTITDEEIVDVMESALQGIAYWAVEAKVTKDGKEVKDFDGYKSEALSNGYDLKIGAEGLWHTLTLEKFLEGLSKRTSFDPENYDMVDGDAIVQYALFGKQVYA